MALKNACFVRAYTVTKTNQKTTNKIGQQQTANHVKQKYTEYRVYQHQNIPHVQIQDNSEVHYIRIYFEKLIIAGKT